VSNWREITLCSGFSFIVYLDTIRVLSGYAAHVMSSTSQVWTVWYKSCIAVTSHLGICRTCCVSNMADVNYVTQITLCCYCSRRLANVSVNNQTLFPRHPVLDFTLETIWTSQLPQPSAALSRWPDKGRCDGKPETTSSDVELRLKYTSLWRWIEDRNLEGAETLVKSFTWHRHYTFSVLSPSLWEFHRS
jgi:hypothetical protein